jgi:cellulose synthase/poly-beta-1,6-N-acetylglucosamine synthase-like glycosyltransferase
MSETAPLRVALIATVLNEAASIHPWLESIAAQTRPPDEIVIVDGGSRDGTVDLLRQYSERLPLKVVVAPGTNISQGRNRAIAETTCPLIASTDAGTRLETEWLARLVAPFERDPDTQAVAGFFQADPDPRSPFEVAMSAAILPWRDEIAPATFLPSSRSVAFRRSAWEAIGGYPDWLDYCEDLVFDFRLRAYAGQFVWIPDAVAHFKARTRLRGFYAQYYRYARGDGKADLWRKRHAIRYLTYLALAPGLLLLAYLVSPLFLVLLLLGAAVYLKQSYRRLPHFWGQLGVLGKAQSVFWVAAIRVVGDVAKMLGYPVGWVWRLKHHPPDWRP